MYVISPGYFIAQAGADMANAAIKSFKTDTHKLSRVKCLSPETRGQLQCYLAVKYGLALIPPARFVGAAFMARMEMMDSALALSKVEVREGATLAKAAAPTSVVSKIDPKVLKRAAMNDVEGRAAMATDFPHLNKIVFINTGENTTESINLIDAIMRDVHTIGRGRPGAGVYS